MNRRSGLVALSAFAAVPGILLTAMRRPQDKLPWRTVRVAGADALSEWERLRATEAGYLIVVGGRDEVERLEEMFGFDDRTPKQILDAAAAVRFPETLIAAQAQDQSDFPIGEWPDAPIANMPLSLARDMSGWGWRDEVYIVVLPIADSSEAPAYLKYGGWNACPAPEVHVAALRRWREIYGFELISMGSDVLEGRVSRRPADREAALALAGEHAVYCTDVIDQGAESLSNLGAMLMAGDWWFFWWD